ncbi:MAG: hypothetical protein RBS43_06075 [Candidatus Cloacimonas sp.]|jgi:hypothetical protein|nr:hypothetical protein [Candidatus Cloacimonas sp.]
MKNVYWLYLVLAAMLMMLSACESGVDFRVVNNCSYPAYVSVDSGAQITIPASGEHTFSLDTDNQSFLTGKVTRDLKVKIIGETYSLFDEDEITPIDSTIVTIGAGESRNAFLTPNRACIKIVNNSSSTIGTAEIWQHTSLSHIRFASLFNIAPGESKFMRVDYAVPNAQYYYQVIIPVVDGDPIIYGDTNNVLANDQQFVVIHTDLGQKH